MPRRKTTTYMSPGEQIGGTVFFYDLSAGAALCRGAAVPSGGRAAGVTISGAMQSILTYYILFAVSIIVFHAFLARTTRHLAENLGLAVKTLGLGLGGAVRPE